MKEQFDFELDEMEQYGDFYSGKPRENKPLKNRDYAQVDIDETPIRESVYTDSDDPAINAFTFQNEIDAGDLEGYTIEELFDIQPFDDQPDRPLY